MSHTPGPWIVGGTGRGDLLVFAAEGRLVCTLADPGAEWNASLIAAAPELLAALKALYSLDVEDSPKSALYLYEAAEAAIAKAEGRS